MKIQHPPKLTIQDYVREIPHGNTVILAQAITLIESEKREDRLKAGQLLNGLLPNTGHSIRIGITGAPGVGKSTFIESFGKWLTAQQKKIAVLAIDPSSSKTRGSILGDKTRMEELSHDPLAFIRPTPSRLTLGGVADHTREAILLCEAAGFEIILVETVGVGQSETTVRSMVDFFLLLLLAGGGDQLQGIKKGIMEMADGIVITKADGPNESRAKEAQAEYQQALLLLSPSDTGWQVPVLISSALEKKGIKETWEMIEKYKHFAQSKGFFNTTRSHQNLTWFKENIHRSLLEESWRSAKLKAKIKSLETRILANELLPSAAASEYMIEYLSR